MRNSKATHSCEIAVSLRQKDHVNDMNNLIYDYHCSLNNFGKLSRCCFGAAGN